MTKRLSNGRRTAVLGLLWCVLGPATPPAAAQEGPADGFVPVTDAMLRSPDAGDWLMAVLPIDAETTAWLYVAAVDGGHLHEGQSIEIRLHAFPHQMYGTLTAIVSHVSAVPIEAGSIEPPLGVNGLVYEVRARLVQGAIEELQDLPVGAPFQADLIRRRWPLYQWLVRYAAKSS